MHESAAIGLDVGGTKIGAGIVSFPSARVIARRRLDTRPERGGQAVLADSVALAKELLEVASSMALPVAGIGIGVAELVDLDGNVTSAHLIDWRGVPVQASFARLAPSVVDSDVRAAALGEAAFGAGKEYDIFAYLTVGTGIGLGLVQGRRPYSGARGSSGTLGYSPLSTVCTQCGSELHPVLAEIAPGPALVTRYKKGGGGKATGGEDVVAAAEEGDVRAQEIVRVAGEALGAGLGFAIDLLDPEAVVVGGGLGLAGGLYWTSLVASTRRHIWSETNRDLPIVTAALGGDAGLIGAAALPSRELVVGPPRHDA